MARNCGHKWEELILSFSWDIHEVLLKIFKMAAAPKSAIKRTIHSPGFFCALNTQSTADFYLPRKRRRKTLGGGQLYSVERVIASRTSKEVLKYNCINCILLIYKKYVYSLVFGSTGKYITFHIVIYFKFKGKEFLVKWLGYSSFESTWEPLEHLTEECIRQVFIK